MDIQNENEEETKRNLGLCMSAGIETLNDEDPNRFQRRHFPQKTTSDIFFCDSPLENNSRKSGDDHNSGDDIYVSAGMDTRYNDQKQSERRHFHISSEDGTMTRNYPDQDEEEQVDSSETAEPRESVGRDDYLSEEMDKHNADPKQSDRRHFHLSNVDYTMISDSVNQDEEQVDSTKSSKNEGRDDFLSEEMGEHHADLKQSDKRHFHLSNVDYTMISDFVKQDEEQVDSTRSRKDEGRDDFLSEEMDKHHIDPKQSDKRHFHLSNVDYTMISDFVKEDEEQVSTKSEKTKGRDDFLAEEMDKHNAKPKQSDRRHFNSSSEDYKMTSPFANRD